MFSVIAGLDLPTRSGCAASERKTCWSARLSLWGSLAMNSRSIRSSNTCTSEGAWAEPCCVALAACSLSIEEDMAPILGLVCLRVKPAQGIVLRFAGTRRCAGKL